MSNTICKTSCKQPEFKTLEDATTSINLGYLEQPELSVCANGFQTTTLDLPIHMYDLLHELLNNPKVVEYYEELRNKG